MGMEIVIVVAHAMGRTLVIPPEQRLYPLGKAHHDPQTNKKVGPPSNHLEVILEPLILEPCHVCDVYGVHNTIWYGDGVYEYGELP